MRITVAVVVAVVDVRVSGAKCEAPQGVSGRDECESFSKRLARFCDPLLNASFLQLVTCLTFFAITCTMSIDKSTI